MSFETFDGDTFENKFDPKTEAQNYKLRSYVEGVQIYIKLETIGNLTIKSEKTITKGNEKFKVYELVGIVEGYDNNKYYAEIFVYELLDNPLKKKQPTVYLKKIKK
jgi:putative translation elongation factor Ts